MELIDKRALMYQLHKQSQIDSKPRAIRRARRMVEECPTVDAVPVEWIKEWTNKYPELVSETAFAWMIEDWGKEQEKQNV